MTRRSFFAATLCASALLAAGCEKMETDDGLAACRPEAVADDGPVTRAVSSNGA